MAHYRFNRYELFTQEDISEVMDIIRDVRDLSMDIEDDRLDTLTNMLYGMYDGYLYDNILTTAASIPQLSMDVIKRIEPIVDMITKHILDNGQSVTPIY